MANKEDFSEIYQELKSFYVNSGDLASALLPFVAQTNDFQLAATMLHTQIQTIGNMESC